MAQQLQIELQDDVDFSLEVIRDTPEAELYSLNVIENRVILGDALEVLAKMEAEVADCVFLDPPYFLQLSGRQLRRWKAKTTVEGVNDDWDHFASFEEYDAFIQRTLESLKRVMKPTATLWVIGTYHNIFRIGKIMQDLGYWFLNDVTWIKTNPMPNWLGVRFTNATETLIWAVKNKEAKGYTFNREEAKRFGVGKVGASVWVLPICTGRERLKGEDGKKVHSTQKPVELLRRVILTSTQPGDLILDPMAGVGTTGHVARTLARRFVMIEINRRYVEAMQHRFETPVRFKEVPNPNGPKIAKYMKLEGLE